MSDPEVTHHARLGIPSASVAVQAYVEGGAIYLDLNGINGIQDRISMSVGDAKKLILILRCAIAHRVGDFE